MNAYDEAHRLAKAIKESDCYKEFFKLKLAIEKDNECKKVIEDFKNRQFELEKGRMMGKEPSADQLQALQKIQGIIQANAKLKTYLEAEYKFARLMSDVQKIIGDALNL